MLGTFGLTGSTLNQPGLQERIAVTIAGQAGWADPNSRYHCLQCRFWDAASKSAKARRCVVYTRMMRRKGPAVPAEAHACPYFELNPKKLRPPPKSEIEIRRERFFDISSWRHSRNRYGNLVRSILGTDMTVCVFARAGRWSWVAHDESGGQPTFSQYSSAAREDAIADLWESVVSLTHPQRVGDELQCGNADAEPTNHR
jgi:hypothetical protein